MRVFSGLPLSDGITVKMVAKTAMPTSSAIRKAGSVKELTTWSVMSRTIFLLFITRPKTAFRPFGQLPQTSKFIILRMTKMPIDIQTPEMPRMRWPVLVVNSGMM